MGLNKHIHIILKVIIIICILIPFFQLNKNLEPLNGLNNKSSNLMESINHEINSISSTWPTFQGSTERTGYTQSTVPLNPEIKWTFNDNQYGVNYRSIITTETYVYFLTNYEIFCLNINDASIEWSKDFLDGMLYTSPTWYDDRLYLTYRNFLYSGTEDERLLCLNANTGSTYWDIALDGCIDYSPTITDGKIITCYWETIGYDDYYTVGCLDAYDHSTIWEHHFPANELHYSTESFTVAFDRVYLFDYETGDTLHCLSLDSGTYLWSHTFTESLHWYPSITASNNRLFCTTRSENPYCLSATSDTILWISYSVYTYSGTASADLDYFYIQGENYYGDEFLYCLDATDGSIDWSYEAYWYADTIEPTVTDSYILFFDGYDIQCLNKFTGTHIWTFNPENYNIESIVVAGGYIFCKYDTGICCIQEQQDTIEPEISLVSSSPLNPDENDNILISASIYDESGIQSATVKYQIDESTWIPELMVLESDTTYLANIGSFASGTSINYYIIAIDNSLNHNLATDDNSGLYYSFTVGSSDYTEPLISSILSSPPSPTDEDDIIISCEVTDESGIFSVSLHYKIDDEIWSIADMPSSSDDSYEVNLGLFEQGTAISYFIEAIDDSLNNNVAIDNNGGLYYTINIGSSDFSDPIITNILHYPEFPTDVDIIEISCMVIDESGISSVTLHYSVDVGIWETIEMNLDTNDIYEVNIGSFEPGDNIQYFISAIDDSLNSNEVIDNNAGLYYTINIGDSDITGPLISNVDHSPSNPSSVDSIIISCNVFDSSGILSVTLHYRIDDGSWQIADMDFVSDDSYEVNINSFSANTILEYYISAIDASLNNNEATEDNGGLYFSVTILPEDTEGPLIQNVSHSPIPPTNIGWVTFSCEVSDLSGIQSVTLYLRINGGSWNPNTMQLISVDTYEIILDSFPVGNFIEYYIVAIDDSYNHNPTTDDNDGSYYSFIVVAADNSPPTIDNIDKTPDTPTDRDIITIYCDVSDLSGLFSVTLHWSYSNDIWFSITMINTVGNTYEASLGPFSIADLISYYIIAVDNSSNHNSAIDDNYGDYYTLNFISYDLIPPEINGIYHSPNVPYDGDLISIFCEVTDNYEVSYVTLHYRMVGFTWSTISMVYQGLDFYKADVGPYNSGITIQYYFSAVDNSSSFNSIIENNDGLLYSFSVIAPDTFAPTIIDVLAGPSSLDDFQNISISCTIIDESGIFSAIVYYRINSGSWFDLEMDCIAIDHYSVNIGILSVDDFIEYYIVAIDNSPLQNTAVNDNDSSYFNYTIIQPDTTGPIIDSILFIPESPISTDVITIICHIVDDNGISSAFVHYRLNTGSWIKVPLSVESEITYSVEIGPFAIGTLIEFYISAIDNSDNLNTAINDNAGLYFSILIQSTSTTPTSTITSSSGLSYIFSILSLIIVIPLFALKRKKVK